MNRLFLNAIQFVILFNIFESAIADTKKINGELYGNVCRSGLVFSVRFAPEYWAPVGSVCNVLRLDGSTFSIGKISYE